MAEEVTVVVQPIGEVQITAGDGVSAVVNANEVIYDPSGTDFPGSITSVKAALDSLANEKFASDSDPGASAAEGDVWYDTDDDKLYVRKNSAWVEILVDTITTLDGGSF